MLFLHTSVKILSVRIIGKMLFFKIISLSIENYVEKCTGT